MSLILEELSANGAVGVAEIAAKLDVSTASIRRDLQTLEEQRLLTRTHGGAAAAAGPGPPCGGAAGAPALSLIHI